MITECFRLAYDSFHMHWKMQKRQYLICTILLSGWTVLYIQNGKTSEEQTSESLRDTVWNQVRKYLVLLSLVLHVDYSLVRFAAYSAAVQIGGQEHGHVSCICFCLCNRFPTWIMNFHDFSNCSLLLDKVFIKHFIETKKMGWVLLLKIYLI